MLSVVLICNVKLVEYHKGQRNQLCSAGLGVVVGILTGLGGCSTCERLAAEFTDLVDISLASKLGVVKKYYVSSELR